MMSVEVRDAMSLALNDLLNKREPRLMRAWVAENLEAPLLWGDVAECLGFSRPVSSQERQAVKHACYYLMEVPEDWEEPEPSVHVVTAHVAIRQLLSSRR